MDGLALSIPALARRRPPPASPTDVSTRVDRTTSTVDATVRTIDRS